MSNNKFQKLLEPGRIGSLKIKNRMIKSGAAARYWGAGMDQVSDRIKFYYEAFARGGIGLVIVEGPSLEPAEARMNGNWRLDDDKYIKGVSELTQIIHIYDCPAFVQLNHTANWQKKMPWEKSPSSPYPPMAPSPVYVKSEMDNNNEMPREITVAEIQEITEKIVSTAVRAQKAGFDGIELNAACTHLFHSFLSPFWNERHDAYGCDSLENRARFLVENIKEIKKRIGQDFPVSVIINGAEFGNLIDVDNSECLTLADSIGIARLLQAAGADAIQVRSIWIGRHDASFLTDHFCYPEPPVPINTFPKEYDWSRRGAGANRFMAKAIKKAVTIPVMTVGRLDPELAEDMLREGVTDFVCFNRRLIADPELPHKVAQGRMDDIAPCTSCTTCKVMGGHRRCRINATIGTDQSYVVAPAAKKKKVVVVGGGPAGMEAARVAAMRGHDVILYEKTRQLGGLLPVAAMVKGLEIECLPGIVRYLKDQMLKNGVDIRLGKQVNTSVIEQIKPDVVIIATGGIPAMPDIPGINHRKVVNSADLQHQLKFFLKFLSPRTLRWLTQFWMPIGKRVVIIGSDIHGCELAEFLTKRGRKVTIVDKAETPGEGMINHLRFQLFWWFRKKGVEMINGVKEYVAVTDKGLVIRAAEGYNRTIPADSIVPATHFSPDTTIFQTLQGKVPEIYAVGDCAEPKLIVDAIGSGFAIARRI
ncbi:MAG: FAD-dependent oxidoreductase [Dehalococcoidales bacterium]